MKATPFTYFYLEIGAITADRVEFSDEESRHMKKVCRISEGEEVCATDGCGNLYSVTVDSARESKVVGHIVDQSFLPAGNWSCHLAVPSTADQKMDWLVEKCTEIGISKFVLFSCERSRAGDVASRKRDRYLRVARAAMKQSMRAYLPEFEFVSNLPSLSQSFPRYGLVLFGHLGESSLNIADAMDGLPRSGGEPKSSLVIVGPESGLTVPESSLLIAAGARPVVFGRHRLRMETAAVVLSAAVAQRLLCE